MLHEFKQIWQDFALAYEAGTVAKCTFHLDKNGNVLSDSVCYNYSGTSDYPPINVLSGSLRFLKFVQLRLLLGQTMALLHFSKGKCTLVKVH